MHDESLVFHGTDGNESTTMEIPAEGKFFINVGSVGQPRDEDPRAAYGFVDTDEQIASIRRVEYDIAAVQRRILAAGLPEVLANRLSLGV